MINFLALLGWSPGGNQEVFSRDELTERFSLDGISGGNAVFNAEKLDWFNQQHIMRLPAAEILRRLRPAIETAGLWRDTFLVEDGAAEATLYGMRWIQRVIDLLKPRARKLSDIVPALVPFVTDSVTYDEAAVTKHLKGEGVTEHLSAWRDIVQALPTLDPAETEGVLRKLAEARGIKPGVLIHATRVAVVGQAVSPGLFEVLELVGRDRVTERLRTAPS